MISDSTAFLQPQPACRSTVGQLKEVSLQREVAPGKWGRGTPNATQGAGDCSTDGRIASMAGEVLKRAVLHTRNRPRPQMFMPHLPLPPPCRVLWRWLELVMKILQRFASGVPRHESALVLILCGAKRGHSSLFGRHSSLLGRNLFHLTVRVRRAVRCRGLRLCTLPAKLLHDRVPATRYSNSAFPP